MADTESTEPTRTQTGAEVARRNVSADTLQTGAPHRLGSDALRGVQSFDDAVELASQVHGEIANFAEKYGSGFDVVDKSIFVNKTIVVLEWRFADGDYGDKFVIAPVVAKDGSKGIITDGSTGIRDQLLRISFDEGKFGGIMIPKGLRVSEYSTCQGMDGKCGVPRKDVEETCRECKDTSTKRGTGRTYYLDESQS